MTVQRPIRRLSRSHTIRTFIAASICALLAALLATMPLRAAASNWTGLEPIQLVRGTALDPGTTLGNYDCKPLTLPVRTVNENGPFLVYDTRNEPACAVLTPAGEIAINKSYIHVGGRPYAQRLAIEGIPKARFVPNPATKGVLALVPQQTFGDVLFYYPDVVAEGVTVDDGRIYRESILQLPAPDAPLRDGIGRALRVQTAVFSPNGQWLVVEVVGTAHRLVRIDMETLRMQPFANGNGMYSISSNPEYHLTISNDGRYVFKAGFRNGAPSIYDVSTCVPSEDSLVVIDDLDCAVRDLSSVFAGVEGFTSLETIRYQEESQHLYGVMNYHEDSSTSYKQQHITIELTHSDSGVPVPEESAPEHTPDAPALPPAPQQTPAPPMPQPNPVPPSPVEPVPTTPAPIPQNSRRRCTARVKVTVKNRRKVVTIIKTCSPAKPVSKSSVGARCKRVLKKIGLLR